MYRLMTPESRPMRLLPKPAPVLNPSWLKPAPVLKTCSAEARLSWKNRRSGSQKLSNPLRKTSLRPLKNNRLYPIADNEPAKVHYPLHFFVYSSSSTKGTASATSPASTEAAEPVLFMAFIPACPCIQAPVQVA